MIRLHRTGVEMLGSIGLEWSTLGLGLVGLMIASPTARKGARALAVTALASGMRVAQGISSFGGQMREEMAQAVGHNQPQAQSQPESQPQPPPQPQLQAEQPAMLGGAPLVQ